MNCQIRGFTSIRKGLGKDHIPFLVDTNSIIASQNVSGAVYVENQGSLRKAIFTKPEGSQSGGVLHLLTERGPKPEGSQFSQTGGILFLNLVVNQQFVLGWVVNTLSFKLTDIIILC